MHRSIDFHVAIDRDIEFSGRELGILHVCELNLEGLGLGDRYVGRYGQDGICRYGHWEDRVEGVVDVLADDVHTTGRPGDELGGLRVGSAELGEESIPSLCFRRERIFRVDVL
jgi:hypothetical protein